MEDYKKALSDIDADIKKYKEFFDNCSSNNNDNNKTNNIQKIEEPIITKNNIDNNLKNFERKIEELENMNSSLVEKNNLLESKLKEILNKNKNIENNLISIENHIKFCEINESKSINELQEELKRCKSMNYNKNNSHFRKILLIFISKVKNLFDYEDDFFGQNSYENLLNIIYKDIIKLKKKNNEQKETIIKLKKQNKKLELEKEQINNDFYNDKENLKVDEEINIDGNFQDNNNINDYNNIYFKNQRFTTNSSNENIYSPSPIFNKIKYQRHSTSSHFSQTDESNKISFDAEMKESPFFSSRALDQNVEKIREKSKNATINNNVNNNFKNKNMNDNKKDNLLFQYYSDGGYKYNNKFIDNDNNKVNSSCIKAKISYNNLINSIDNLKKVINADNTFFPAPRSSQRNFYSNIHTNYFLK